MAGKSSHFRSIWLTPSASLVFLLLLGGTAPAATLSFRPVPGHGAALVFKLTGVKSEEVRAAYLERKGRRDKLNVHVARKAAERGVLKLLTPRKKQSPGSRRHVLGRAKSDPKLILVVADSASVGPASPSPSGVLVAGSTPTMFRAAADAYVSSANRSRNYGTRRYLYADSSPRVRSYLRFNVKGLKGLVSRATLELYARGSSSVGLDVRPVSNNEWNEKTIIYTKARSIKPAVGSTGTFGSGRWVRLDVTSLVSGNGAVSFVVSTPSSKAIKFASRETGRKAPRL